ncbi:hypothetical protein ACFL3G_07600 [Planctomycetota bacterium]
MSISLDGHNLFDERDVEIECGSERRASIERAVGGVDGVVSVDLGSRERVVKQQGVLRAKSRPEMYEKVDAISAYIDGDTHVLVVSADKQLDNLRMDSFKYKNLRTSGNGFCLDYEIVYTQLKV